MSVPQRIIGPFEIHERIGVGGMGMVYRAIYTKTGLPVAIKILAPDLSNEEPLQRRFEREVSILKKLKHPNIVRYYASGKVGMQRFYAMELISGGSLEDVVKQKKKLPWQEAVEYALQIALALEYAHEAGVIHRDLKPANLLIGPDGLLKLTDFGIARDTTATALTAAGRTVGTYAYMAPEQIRGKPPVDRKTDLYALGCVLFELIAGETPFVSDNGGEIMMMHLNEPPPRISSLVPGVPHWLETLIFDLLEKDPNERPYDALAVHTKLEEIKQKVESGIGLAASAMSGDQLGATVLDPKLQKLLKGDKKKKKKVAGPLYEQAWFLAACLLLVTGLAWYLMQPPTAPQLLSRGREVFRGKFDDDDERDMAWMNARDDFLLPLLNRYPNSHEAAEAQQMIDEIEVGRLERTLRSKVRLGRDPENQAERLVMDAMALEKLGDEFSALESYGNVIEQLRTRDKDRYLLLVAQKRRAFLEESDSGRDRVELVQEVLARADQKAREGNLAAAKKLWNSVVELYGKKPELAQYVKQARRRLLGKPDDPSASEPEPITPGAAAPESEAQPEEPNTAPPPAPNGDKLPSEASAPTQ